MIAEGNPLMSDPKLVLIDGHSLAFRAFHAIPLSLTSPSGELTNAVFGFTSMLLNVLREQAAGVCGRGVRRGQDLPARDV